ncbi:hypothetical protein V6N11_064935 [Hibiscus sabdariffa]|uniref:RNase H type-1 domain-containing protein n=1 Tax=Hibiscus sabdariffa TaxID=183260 RepID=A0ABR2SIQ6_9ROSI
MSGLDTSIVTHKLPLKPECKPVQQKLRRMRPEMLLQIRDEVRKQFDAGFLQVAKYPEWVANVVPVPKKNGKVRMCVGYCDLNHASPKDNFPLPHIDTLVDNTAKHCLFSFMDGFSGYNQIKMAPKDMEKTTFVTMWGTFSYKVMPFSLKNAGATYQRAMVTLFHDMMHKEMEVYVDDMIAKSQTEDEHITNLRKLFERLRKFQLKLNPAKCTFVVASGKLLGFVDSKRGIEVDMIKSRLFKSFPLLEAFEKVKSYLSNPPVLVPLVPRKSLILYLAIFENSMGCVLGQHDETGRKERAIYYLGKKFTDYPIKYMMESPGLSGRLARLQILLSEYDIEYVSQKAIKGNTIADFLASRTLAEYEHLSFDFPDEDLVCQTVSEEGCHTEKPWRINFDGASNAHGHGIGAILVSLEGDHYPFIGRLNFDCTNNVAEYEACIMGLHVAIQREIEILEVYSDPSLVIYQLRGEWETRDAKLARYRKLVLELIKEFKRISFHYFPREDNQMADALATLASIFKANREADIMPIWMSIYD